MGITNLTISYPDFKMSEVIEPDHFDTNNADIKNKVNAIIAILNQITDSITDGGSGADKISLTAITPFTSTKLQAYLEEVVTRLRATTDGASGADLIGSTAITGVTGTTIQTQLESLKTLLDGYLARLTTAENDINALETRATNVENRATSIEGRATSLESRATALENNKTDKTTTSALDTRVVNLENNKTDKTTTSALDTRVGSLESNKTDKTTTSALDTRVVNLESGKADKTTTYTKTDVDNKLADKTNVTGNHQGTWQGFNPTDFDAGEMRTDLDNHVANTSNPHGTTATQVGAYTKVETDSMVKGFGLGTVAKDITGTDLNTLDATGFYTGGSLLNAPLGANYTFNIYNLKRTVDSRSQIAITGTTTNPTAYMRTQHAGIWGAWLVMATQEWVKLFGLGGVTPGVDWNTPTANGFFQGSANNPRGNNTTVFNGLHIQSSDVTAFQVVGRLQEFYMRNKDSGVWADWVALAGFSKIGNLSSPSQSYVRARGSGAQSITAGVATKVTLATTEDYDAQNEYASTRFTAKEEGVYLVQLYFDWGSNIPTGDIYTKLYRNGAVFQITSMHSAIKVGAGEAFIKLSAGDYLEFYIEQYSGGVAKTLSYALMSVIKLS